MRIAVFSDVHANLPALEALFRELDRQQPDAVYCLGDLVGYNVWPNEVVEAVRQRGIPVIAGNYDEGIGARSSECGCAYKTEEDRAMGNISIAYTNEVMREDARRYLHELPAHIRLEWKLNGQPFQVLLVHGSPRRVNEYLFEDRDENSLLRIMRDAGADVLCFGHTHKPFHRPLYDPQTGRYRHAVNTGSVGKPKDGDNRGCYVLLEWSGQPDLADASAVGVQFCRFAYDVEKAARAIEESILPNAYARMLREAY